MVSTRRAWRATLVVGVVLTTFTYAALAAAQTFDGEQDPQPQRATLAIVGGLLIDGHEGPPVPGAVVLVDGNRIVAVGSRDALDVPDGAQVLDATGMTIMPGLIDVHVHMDILGHSDYQHWHATYGPRYAEIMEISARQLLLSGVTTVADLAGQPDALISTRQRIESGQIPGPRVIPSLGWIRTGRTSGCNATIGEPTPSTSGRWTKPVTRRARQSPTGPGSSRCIPG